MNVLRFHDPVWLLLLIPLGLLAWVVRGRIRRRAVLYSDAGLLRALPVTFAQRVKRVLPWVKIVGLALVILAMARPQRGLEEFRIRTEGIAIQMCIDRSGSMQAMDFQIDGKRVDRLDAVKRVFNDFVAGKDGLRGRVDDQIGLIAFGGFAEDKCPLTLDHGALLQVLESVEIPEPILDSEGRMVNERLLEEDMATAIGDAVVLAADRLGDVTAKSKVVILLSDGKHNAGVVDPQQAAEAAKTLGIKVYTIGVGSTGMAPFPGRDPFGREVLVAQRVELDEATLKMVAETTGGRYFNAKDTDALRGVYAEIDKLEKTTTEGRLYTQYRELYQYLVMPGLGLILLQLVLVSTRFRSLP